MKALVALLVAATLAIGIPAPARASDRDVSITTSQSHPWSGWDHSRIHGHRHTSGRVIVVPAPIYVVPSRCWVQGYWNYAWVPQVSAYNVWVDGAWSPDGYWIDGHYEQAASNGGYWQPYWVEGRWSAC